MNIIGQIKERITAYLDVQLKLVKINFILGTSNVLSYLLFAMIGLFILFSIILFIGFGLTEVFVELGLSRMAALFIVTGIYVLLLLLLLVCRKGVTRFFSSKIVNVMTESGEEEEEE